MDLLDGEPLTTGEWQAAAEAEGYSRATFFRIKGKLVAAKRVTMDHKSETWTRANDGISQLPVSEVKTDETGET